MAGGGGFAGHSPPYVQPIWEIEMNTPHSIPDYPEAWRPVIGWEPYYEVSTLGRVRSLERRVTNTLGVTQVFRPVLRRCTLGPNGYQTVTTSVGDRRANHLVHRLMLLAFIGDVPFRKPWVI